ncbi:phosphonate C-P lyase system protein PhnH [Acidisphaera sp. L21]|uniref:phosphonate C-P lyase system protein PhnH n=1 Tax=Acidisphaera sp. L21 TaxID=1641851 RepID=UPI00131E108A|nr:phosphonate C-P lyase system protein PhnH [Acidisphaera sp. L21]
MSVDLPGFAQPVADAQSCFRAVLDAMSHPGRVLFAGVDLAAPSPLAPATAAVLLTLADAETPIWLEPAAADAADWLRFHCGAMLVEPGEAQFAVCLGLSSLAPFNWGTHEGPEASATLIVQIPSFDAGPRLRLSGPGLRVPETVRLGALPADFVDQWRANHAAYPRGIDLVLCAGSQLAALPRSITIEAA